jgi:hypothetical protein
VGVNRSHSELVGLEQAWLCDFLRVVFFGKNLERANEEGHEEAAEEGDVPGDLVVVGFDLHVLGLNHC